MSRVNDEQSPHARAFIVTVGLAVLLWIAAFIAFRVGDSSATMKVLANVFNIAGTVVLVTAVVWRFRGRWQEPK